MGAAAIEGLSSTNKILLNKGTKPGQLPSLGHRSGMGD